MKEVIEIFQRTQSTKKFTFNAWESFTYSSDNECDYFVWVKACVNQKIN